MRLLCDASKLRSRTGWRPGHNRDEGLRHTIDWFREPSNLARYPLNQYNS